MLGSVIRWLLLGGIVAVGGCAVGTHFAWALFEDQRPCRIQIESALAQPVRLLVTGRFEDPSEGRRTLPRMRFEGLPEKGELEVLPGQRVELSVYAGPVRWTPSRLAATGRLYGQVQIDSPGSDPAIHESIPVRISVAGPAATYWPVLLVICVWAGLFILCWIVSWFLATPVGTLRKTTFSQEEEGAIRSATDAFHGRPWGPMLGKYDLSRLRARLAIWRARPEAPVPS